MEDKPDYPHLEIVGLTSKKFKVTLNPTLKLCTQSDEQMFLLAMMNNIIDAFGEAFKLVMPSTCNIKRYHEGHVPCIWYITFPTYRWLEKTALQCAKIQEQVTSKMLSSAITVCTQDHKVASLHGDIHQIYVSKGTIESMYLNSVRVEL